MADPTDDPPDDEPIQPDDGSSPKPKRGVSIEDLAWLDGKSEKSAEMGKGGKPRKVRNEETSDRPSGSEFLTKDELYRRYPGTELLGLQARQKAEDRDTQRTIKEETVRSTNALLAAQTSARLSTTLTAIAAGAALLALVTSLSAYKLAFSDDEHDRRWRAEQRAFAVEQLRVLEEIRARLPPP